MVFGGLMGTSSHPCASQEMIKAFAGALKRSQQTWEEDMGSWTLPKVVPDGLSRSPAKLSIC